jgi:hypothetical protein
VFQFIADFDFLKKEGLFKAEQRFYVRFYQVRHFTQRSEGISEFKSVNAANGTEAPRGLNIARNRLHNRRCIASEQAVKHS